MCFKNLLIKFCKVWNRREAGCRGQEKYRIFFPDEIFNLFRYFAYGVVYYLMMSEHIFVIYQTCHLFFQHCLHSLIAVTRCLLGIYNVVNMLMTAQSMTKKTLNKTFLE